MLQTLIHRLLKRRHFWRYATFSEVAELYATRALRMLGLNMITAFAAVYLYQNGYSLKFIGFYYTVYFLLRTVAVVPCAYLVAHFGPKHTILMSNISYVFALVTFALVPQFRFAALVIFGIVQSISTTLHDVSYEVDFSKVSHLAHAGKELGYMNIVEKISAGLSPLVGGVVAFLFGPQVTIMLAALLFIIAAIPLFWSAEPVQTRQRLTFAGFPFRLVWRQVLSRTAIGFDMVASSHVWNLFIVIVVVGTTTNEMYAQIGIYGTITLFAALIISYVFGRLIDENRGGELLGYGVLLDSLTHFFRPFVGTPVGVIGTNVFNEMGTTGYSMPFMKGMFDMADRLAGFRIAYICVVSSAIGLGCTLAALTFALLVSTVGDRLGIHLFFVVTGIVVLFIRTHRFPLYRR